MILAVFSLSSGCAKKKIVLPKTHPAVIPARVITVKTKEEAEKLRRQLSQGANFAKLARQYSTHPSAKKYGNLGRIVPWELEPAYRRALSGLKPGQFSRVFKTAEGYAILYYIDNQHLEAGIRQFEARQYKKAAQALELDISQNPDHLQSYSYLGLAYDKLGQTAKAVRVFETLTALDPEYPAAQNNLGSAYSKNKQYEKAIQAYSEALVQSPNDPAIMNNLAWALAKQKRSLDIALKLAERAILLRPLEPEYWDTEAEIHLARGEKIKALEKINKAIELGGNTSYFKARRKQIASLMVKENTQRQNAPAAARPPGKTAPGKTAPPALVTKKKEFYAVQVVATKRLASAKKIKDLFYKRGYRAFIENRNIPGKGLFHRVRIGPFNSYVKAKETAKEIKEKYRQESIIMKYTQ